MVFAVGQTVTSGIQDVSALLPLLGTEQCEEHIGSSLDSGFLYAAIAPLSIFGSLGIVSAGLKAIVASVVVNRFGKKVIGAQVLANAGFGPTGKVLSLIMWRDSCFAAEMELAATLEELHITDVKKLSLAGATKWVWNLLMLFASFCTIILSITPYIYFIINNRGDPLSWRWLLPVARSVGSALVSNLTQIVIQIRLLEITNARVLFLTLDNIIHDENIILPSKWDSAGWWGPDRPSEVALYNLKSCLRTYFRNSKSNPAAHVNERLATLETGPYCTTAGLVRRVLSKMCFKRPASQTVDCERNLLKNSSPESLNSKIRDPETTEQKPFELADSIPATASPQSTDAMITNLQQIGVPKDCLERLEERALDPEMLDLGRLDFDRLDLDILTRERHKLEKSMSLVSTSKEAGHREDTHEKLFFRLTNLDIIADAHKLNKLKDKLDEAEKTGQRSFLLLVLSQIAIACGMVLTLIGYVGCFSLVQSSTTSFGPLLWLIVEVVLSLTRLAVWAFNPTWDETQTFFTLHLKLAHHPPLPTCDKFSEELDEEGDVPLARSREFLGDITSFVGILEPLKINEDGVAVYYTMTRRTSGERTLYVTISDYKENISRTLIYPSRNNATSGMDCHVAKLHAEDGEGDDGTVWATIMFKTSMDDSHITEDRKFATELKTHCSSIVEKVMRHASDANQYVTQARPPLEIRMTWVLKGKQTEQKPSENRTTHTQSTGEDDLVYLRFGELERLRRGLCWQRGKWVEEYVSWTNHEALEEFFQISREREHLPAASRLLPLFRACTEYFMSYELEMMEIMLVDETRQLEALLRRRGETLIESFHKIRKEDEQWVALKRKISVEWKKNALRRVRKEAGYMEKRIAKFREEAQLRVQQHPGPMAEASKVNWQEALDRIEKDWHHLVQGAQNHEYGDETSTRNRDTTFDIRNLDKLIIQHEYQDPAVPDDMMDLVRTGNVTVDPTVGAWLDEKISGMSRRLNIERDRRDSRLEAMKSIDEVSKECRKFDGSPFSVRLMHKQRFVKLPSNVQVGAGVDTTSAIADALKWNSSISWVGCTEFPADQVVAIIASAPWKTHSVTLAIPAECLNEEEGKRVSFEPALRRNKSILSLVVPAPHETPTAWKDVIASNRKNAFASINDSNKPLKLIYYELATIFDAYTSSGNPHLRFYWPGQSSCTVMFSIPGGAGAKTETGELFLRLDHGCPKSRTQIDIMLNARRVSWAQYQCPQDTLGIQDIVLPCDILDRNNRNELKINLLGDERSSAEYWLRDVRFVWRDVKTGKAQVW
ncbi:hypothetical protein EIP86_001006 [Pleurotus ostreatoroseus]|nr:hypothetical protein EIP86_001006 [Pleurotus ostreatoroseus]